MPRSLTGRREICNKKENMGETNEINSAIDLVRNPELLNRNTIPLLQEAIKQYPFHQTLYLLLLQNMYKVHDPQFSKALKRYAVMVADRTVLFEMVEGMNYNIPIQKLEGDAPMADGDRTLALIDNFLRSIPDTQQPTAVKAEKSDLQADYSSYLEQLPDFEERKEDEALTPAAPAITLKLQDSEEHAAPSVVDSEYANDEFTVPAIRQHLEDAGDLPPVDDMPDDAPGEEYFTEAMAAIYIKQHKFEHALEIIRAISADNPKKSVYFADQIRYLELLVRLNGRKR